MTRWFTLLVFLSWLLVYWQGGWKILTDIRHAAQSKASRLDVFLLAWLAALGLAMTVTAVLVTTGWVKTFPDTWLAGFGCLLTLTGVVGTFYCRAVLGKFWTAEAAKQANHTVIDYGPYGMVRHPIYSFAILLYLGLGLVFPVWWNLLAMAGIAIGYMLKAWSEEKFLTRQLPGCMAYRRVSVGDCCQESGKSQMGYTDASH